MTSQSSPGLRELVNEHLDLGRAPGRANVGDKLLTLVASALAGGDSGSDYMWNDTSEPVRMSLPPRQHATRLARGVGEHAADVGSPLVQAPGGITRLQ